MKKKEKTLEKNQKDGHYLCRKIQECLRTEKNESWKELSCTVKKGQVIADN